MLISWAFLLLPIGSIRLINSCDITIYILQVIPGNVWAEEGFRGFVVLHLCFSQVFPLVLFTRSNNSCSNVFFCSYFLSPQLLVIWVALPITLQHVAEWFLFSQPEAQAHFISSLFHMTIETISNGEFFFKNQ